MSSSNRTPAELAADKPVLISHPLCPYVQRAVITLAEKGVAFERIDVDLANKPAWFKALSPLGKVPLLKQGDSLVFESAVIAEYLEETQPGRLHPADPLEKARHRSWIEFASATLNAIGSFYGAKEGRDFERARRQLIDRFARLELELDGAGPYFAGADFHLLDAAWGPVFRYFDVFDRIGHFGFFEGLAKVQAYRKALAARPSIRNAVAADYPERLRDFLQSRGSALSALIVNRRLAA